MCILQQGQKYHNSLARGQCTHGRKKQEKSMVEVVRKLDKKFKITCDTRKENIFSYHGMKIEVCLNGIFMNQSRYAERILERFHFEEMNPVYTPIEREMVTDPGNFVNDRPLETSKPYQEAVGSLLYLATITRPGISFSMNYLSRYNKNPMTSHWKMIKRVFQYVKGTIKFGIFFNGENNLTVHSDSDYGGDTVSGHSTNGLLLIPGGPLI